MSRVSTDIFAYDEPCLSIRLEYMADEADGPLSLAEQAILALDAMASGWLAPLAWEMDVGCLDTESMHAAMTREPPQPFWLLRKEQIPAGVEIDPIYGNHTVVIEPALSSERIHAWLATALAQTCADAPRFIPCWGRFFSLAMRARIPEAVCNTVHQSLDVSCYAGTIALPLHHTNDQVWVSGPPERYLIGPPVSLTASNLHGMLVNLDLAVFWSLWSRDPAGRAQVEAAVDRVLALGRGWQRSEG